MTTFAQRLTRAAIAAMFTIAIAACGSGGRDSISTAPAVSSNPPDEVSTDEVEDEVVTGVALPSTVAVVTATNAN
jgi:hypothetical protein